MSGARFVRFYPSDWRSGCMGLSLEQEGFYIRLCSYVFETGLRLPANDSAAAKFMGLHTNAYRKIRNQLADIGKVILREDGWTVARAEKELASALGTSASGRSADQDGGRNTRPDTLGESPPETPLDTTHVSVGVFSQNDNEINGPSLEPIANSQRYDDVGCAREAPQFSIDEETCIEFHRICTTWGQKPDAITFGQPTIDDTNRQLAGEVKGMAVQHPEAPPRILHAALLTALNSLTAKSMEPQDGQFKGRGSSSAASYLRKTYSSEILRMMREDANAEASARADHFMQRQTLERRAAPRQSTRASFATLEFPA